MLPMRGRNNCRARHKACSSAGAAHAQAWAGNSPHASCHLMCKLSHLLVSSPRLGRSAAWGKRLGRVQATSGFQGSEHGCSVRSGVMAGHSRLAYRWHRANHTQHSRLTGRWRASRRHARATPRRRRRAWCGTRRRARRATPASAPSPGTGCAAGRARPARRQPALVLLHGFA